MTYTDIPISPPRGTSVRRLAGLAITYSTGEVLIKGLNYLLLPLYLRFLSPQEYGIIAITEVLRIILGLLLSFGLTGAILRFIHVVDEGDQPSFFGSIWFFLMLTAGSVTILLLLLSPAFFQTLTPSVEFNPYIQKTILAAFLNSSFALMPATMFRARDRAKKYVAFGLISAALVTTATILRVVIFKQEAAGWVQAQMEGAVGIALISAVILLREVEPRFAWRKMKSVLLFSLPLMPHFIAHWILGVSDRMILERNVSLTQLGLYSLGYQFGQAFQVIVTGLNNAMIPMFGRASKERDELIRLPKTITYYLLAVTSIALFLSLVGGDVIELIFPSNYEGASAVVPWIVAGYLLLAVYYIPTNYLAMTTGDTKLIPLSTISAAAVNVTLNLVFIPRFGMMSAAVNTAIGYGVLAITMTFIARKDGPLPLQFSRIAKLAGTSVLMFLVSPFILRFDPLVNISIGAGLTIAVPILLTAIGFWGPNEIQNIRRIVIQLAKNINRVKG